MGTGQTIITLGALTLLSYAVLNFNRTVSSVDVTIIENKYRLEALSMLNQYAETTKQHYFDETTLDTTSNKELTDLTLPKNLGMDYNDSGVIDDFDDYNGYTIADTANSGMPFVLYFEVEYVKLSGAQLEKSSSREYHKRMRIRIWDDYPEPLMTRYKNGVAVRDTLEISFVSSYWFYN